MNLISKDIQTSKLLNSKKFEFSLPLNSKMNTNLILIFLKWNTVLNFVHVWIKYTVLISYQCHNHEGQFIVVSSREHIFGDIQMSGWQNKSYSGSQLPGWWWNWQVYIYVAVSIFVAFRHSCSSLEHHRAK